MKKIYKLALQKMMIKRRDFKLGDISSKPGVYIFRDQFKQVIYVGKAKSLRKRLASYFQASKSKTADPRIRSLINSIAFIELNLLNTEQESLLLENKLIKEYTPRYNILLRDDKRFLLIKVDLNKPYPRIDLVRLRKDDIASYYGPFPVAGSLRETVDYMISYFGLRTCQKRVPDELDYKHCNDDIIRQCSAPCLQKISSEEYKERVMAFIKVIEGKYDKELIEQLADKMKHHAAQKNFEMAARLRDIQRNLQDVFRNYQRNFKKQHREYPGMPGVEDLQAVLKLDDPPIRIECFDISNIMGAFTVASMVCFEKGKPNNRRYRQYKIQSVEGIDDFESMREVVYRRYNRQLEENRQLPDLIVIDGGPGQLSSANQMLFELDIEDIPIVSLAKREEEIFLPYSSESILLERHRPALKLLQALRDEAHRFAITFNRELRRKQINNSLLDEIPGVGKKRKEELLKKFGSVKTLRKYDKDEIIKRIPGIGEKLAEDIVAFLKKSPDN